MEILFWTKDFLHTLYGICYDIKILVTLFALSELDVAFSHAACKHTSTVCRWIKIQGVAKIHFWCWCKHFTRNKSRKRKFRLPNKDLPLCYAKNSGKVIENWYYPLQFYDVLLIYFFWISKIQQEEKSIRRWDIYLIGRLCFMRQIS